MRAQEVYGLTVNDILLVVLLLLISAFPLFYFYQDNNAEKRLVVTHLEKKEYYSLSKDSDFTVNNVNFRIENKTVRVISANCPEQVCVNTGAISKSGSSIICAYNRVLAEITGEGAPAVDAVAY